MLDFNSLVALFKQGDLEKQFRAFFPTLTEEDQNCLEKKHFNFDDLPYQLKIENISGYMEDCHFCGNSYCRSNCPLPYSSKETVLDTLHKIGVEDNISFYGGNKGKRDLILNILWHRDFEDAFIK